MVGYDIMPTMKKRQISKSIGVKKGKKVENVCIDDMLGTSGFDII